MKTAYDIIVVGAGHAGIEAALAGARIGFKTLLITINLDTVGLMPCNPSIGGPGKGHIVREIDALGGEMARNIDRTHIHNRMLNTSKGPAVQALRAQADKKQYQFRMKNTLENTPNLHLKQAMVKNLFFNIDKSDLLKNRDKYASILAVKGIETDTGETFLSNAIVITTGTFLNGKIHIGDESYAAGRLGEFASVDLTRSLEIAGLPIGRLKTGTVPRVDSRSIDYSKCREQKPVEDPLMFSYFSEKAFHNPQVSCWITSTNEKTHEIIQANFSRSPLFDGRIKGIGPRYCPSIEDKVQRFSGRDNHPVFIEPEGLKTNEIYLQGLSTSLPIDVQKDMLCTINGLEHVEIMRPGYAIEYDYVNPIQLYPSLMSKIVSGLFFAGQINGTSGYEEAAAQGIVAGINVTAFLRRIDPMILSRADSYTGVLINDLVTKGTTEPYRMFTARVEHRLNLRFDNADDRLSDKGHSYGLLNNDDYAKIIESRKNRKSLISSLKVFHVKRNCKTEALEKYNGKSLYDTVKIPGIRSVDVSKELPENDQVDSCSDYDYDRIDIEIKYDGYIKKEAIQLNRLADMEKYKIPADFDFSIIQNISKEARQKLNTVKPLTIGQASLVLGVSPSDLTVIMYFLKNSGTTNTPPPCPS